MNRMLPLCLLLVAVLLAGCSPQADAPAKRQAEVSSTTVPAAMVSPPVQDAAKPLAEAAPPPLPASPPAEARMKADMAKLSTAVAAGGRVVQSQELDALRAPSEPTDREQYAHQEDNPVKRVAEQPISTFSIDVDTGSYANVRRFLNEGRLPPRDAVRVEEMINYFNYDYPLPDSRQPPFRVSTELAPTPMEPENPAAGHRRQGLRFAENAVAAR